MKAVPTIPDFNYGVFRSDMVKEGDPLFRGERNNNPGNLVNTPETWKGEIVPGHDSKFMEFRSATLGIRALAKLLLNYEKKYKLNTVAGLISRWAPPNENDTKQYIKDAAEDCGVGEDEPISVQNYLFPLVCAIIKKENGRVAYTAETIMAGITMATVSEVDGSGKDKPEPLAGMKALVEITWSGVGLDVDLHIIPIDYVFAQGENSCVFSPQIIVH